MRHKLHSAAVISNYTDNSPHESAGLCCCEVSVGAGGLKVSLLHVFSVRSQSTLRECEKDSLVGDRTSPTLRLIQEMQAHVAMITDRPLLASADSMGLPSLDEMSCSNKAQIRSSLAENQKPCHRPSHPAGLCIHRASVQRPSLHCPQAHPHSSP